MYFNVLCMTYGASFNLFVVMNYYMEFSLISFLYVYVFVIGFCHYLKFCDSFSFNGEEV